MRLNSNGTWNCESCGRGLDLCVHVVIKQYLFLQGIQLISKAFYSQTGFLQLFPGCAHCLVINLWGHFGIIQLEGDRLCVRKSALYIFQQHAAESGASQRQDNSTNWLICFVFIRVKNQSIFSLGRLCVRARVLKDKRKNICRSPWPGRFVPVLPYKERLAHHVASLGPGGIT